MTLWERMERYTQHGTHITDCDIWTGARLRDGRPVVWAGRTRHARRVAWELRMGGLPDGAEMRRTCDTPHCVNPLHHYLLYPRTGRALYSSNASAQETHAVD